MRSASSHRRFSRASCRALSARWQRTPRRSIRPVRYRRQRIDTSELQENWQPRLYARLIALVVLLAYAIAFVLENRRTVNVHFVFVTASVSLIWLVLVALAVGVVGGILLGQLERRRRRKHRA